ncbi:MAG: FAD-binding oxidoreductase [Pseudomonadota bacterium]
MQMTSYWQATAPRFDRAKTEVEGQYDVAIVGGGFTGLSAARHLAKSGCKVAVLEAREVGHGASCRNGGHLNNGMAHGYGDAMARFGADGARRLYQAYDASIDQIEQVIEDEQIDCNFRRSGKLKIASKPGHVAGLKASCDLIRKEADSDVVYLDQADLAGEIQSTAAYAGMLYPKSAMMHMGRYMHGLAMGVTRHGGDVHETAPVTAMHRDGGSWQLTTPLGALSARHVIVATGAYSGQFASKTFRHFTRRIIPVGSFIIVTRPLTDADIAASVPGNRTYVTSLNVGHYFRLSPDNRLIFGGRARFSSTINPAGDAASARILRDGLAQTFPALAGAKIDYCFGGLVDMTRDRLPRAGQVDGMYYAMGYSGHGAQMSNQMGVVLADMILGKGTNPLADMSWPAIPMYTGRPWFLPVVGAYYRFKDMIG